MKWLSRKFIVFVVNIIIVIGMIIKEYQPSMEMVLLIIINSVIYLFVEGILDVKRLEKIYEKSKKDN